MKRKVHKLLLAFGMLFLLNSGFAKTDSTGTSKKNWEYSVNCLTISGWSLYTGTAPCTKYAFTVNGTTIKGQQFSYTFPKRGTYQVCLKISDSCKKWDTTICKSITVDTCAKNPCDRKHEITLTNDCRKFKFKVSPSGSGYTYAWYANDSSSTSTSTDSIFTHAFAKNGTYYVCVKITWASGNTRCSATICRYVKVNCEAPCELKGDFSFKSNGTNSFKFNATSNTGYYYEWDFGDGSKAYTKDPVHKYNKPGTYTVCVTIWDKSKRCKVKICKTITIEKPCNLLGGFSINNLGNGNFKFEATSNGGTSYTWNFGDGTTATGKSVSKTYTKSGVYEVCVTISNGNKKCDIKVCRKVEVTVKTKCNWAKTITAWGVQVYKADTCAQKMVFFASFLNNNGCIIPVWKVYNNNTSTPTVLYGREFVYQFANAGTYQFCVTFYDSCNNCDTTICGSFTVKKCATTDPCKEWKSIAKWGYSATSAANTYFFEAPVFADGCKKYKWTNGGTVVSTSRTFTKTFTASSTFTLCLTITDTCKKCDTTICKTVTIDVAKCNWGKLGVTALGTPTIKCRTIVMEGKNLNDSCVTYTWATALSGTNTLTTIGTSRVLQYTFANDGTYYLCLKYTNKCKGCDTTICTAVTIKCCNVTASFVVDSISAGGKLYVRNTSTGGAYYYWTFGDSSASGDKTPTKTYAKSGTYKICVTVYDSAKKCSSTYCYTVTVNRTRSNTAFIKSATKLIGSIAPNPSNGEVNVSWNFNASTVVIYNTAGMKMATYVVNNSSAIKLNTGSWAEGVYLVSIKGTEGTAEQRLVVTK